MVFCDIDNQLLEIIHNHAKGRKIIDLGAGECLFQFKYNEKYPDDTVISVEPFAQSNYFISPKNVIPLFADAMPILDNDLPIVIRPCHSDRFLPSFLKLNSTKIAEVLYIGKPYNLEIDIPENYKVEIISEWQGKEGERIFQIKLFGKEYSSNIIQYFNVQLQFWKQPEKMRKEVRNGKDFFVNSLGGGFPCESIDIILCEQI